MASLTFTAADKRKLGFGLQIPLDILLSELQSDWFVDWHSDGGNSFLGIKFSFFLQSSDTTRSEGRCLFFSGRALSDKEQVCPEKAVMNRKTIRGLQFRFSVRAVL